MSRPRQPTRRKQVKPEAVQQTAQRQSLPHPVGLVLDAGPTLMAYVGVDGRYRWANQVYERWFGKFSEEIQGRHVREILGEEAWQVVRPYVERALCGETITYEQALPKQDGHLRWLRATYTPDCDETGRIAGFIVHAMDIGEYKQSEDNLLREKAFSESAINSMPGIFYLFDRNGTFLRWNHNFEEVSGYSSQEISAMNPLDFFNPEDKGIIANAINHVFTEGQVQVEASFVSKSGQSTSYYFTGLRMFVDGTPYLIGSGIDLTGRKEAEETQRATLNILEDFDEERQNFQLIQKATLNLLEDMHEERNQLDQTQRALLNILEDIDVERTRVEQAKALLEAVNKELEAFSYSVSHDLRAPLRAISGFAQAVVEDCEPQLDEEGKRFLGLIQQNAHRMGQLIDDLLSFSRLGRQQLLESRIDMEAMVKAVFKELVALAPDRKIKLTVHPAPPAHGDKAMIRQVLANLISNAIKFTRPREEALIEFGYRPESDAKVGAYFVKDNGVGFDMQYVDKLFGVFQRLHSVTAFEGTGVGLALVYRIITRHGGRIWAEGQVDQGATFYFTLQEREVE
ncbi:MAG: PAS domain S-box protein [Chloroflexota bacterium]|nr:MAG: PAS domain S-box protein [Chloroflexota bacterium]